MVLVSVKIADFLLSVGLFLGLGIGLAMSGPLGSLMYRVNPRDPVVIAVVALALAAAGHAQRRG